MGVHWKDYVCPYCGNNKIEFYFYPLSKVENGRCDKQKVIAACPKCKFAKFAKVYE